MDIDSSTNSEGSKQLEKTSEQSSTSLPIASTDTFRSSSFNFIYSFHQNKLASKGFQVQNLRFRKTKLLLEEIRTSRATIIQSPPASGKTRLLQILETNLGSWCIAYVRLKIDKGNDETTQCLLGTVQTISLSSWLSTESHANSPMLLFRG